MISGDLLWKLCRMCCTRFCYCNNKKAAKLFGYTDAKRLADFLEAKVRLEEDLMRTIYAGERQKIERALKKVNQRIAELRSI